MNMFQPVPSLPRHLALTAACAALVALGTKAGAQNVEVRRIDCENGVHLVARQAALRDVLRELSEALDFRLQLDGSAGTLIDVDAIRPPVELVSSLSPRDSVIVTQSRDPRCPGRNRIVKVWVLPASEAAARESAAQPPSRVAPPPPARAIVTERVVRGSPELEEQSRRAKAAYDEYVRIHGKAPPGVAEETAQ
jgi:hypothetical protein